MVGRISAEGQLQRQKTLHIYGRANSPTTFWSSLFVERSLIWRLESKWHLIHGIDSVPREATVLGIPLWKAALNTVYPVLVESLNCGEAFLNRTFVLVRSALIADFPPATKIRTPPSRRMPIMDIMTRAPANIFELVP